MIILLLLSAMLLFAPSVASAQTLISMYNQPIHPYCLSTPFYSDLVNHGGINARQDILVKLSNGKVVEMPIINGWVPNLTIQNNSDGSERHIFDYRERRQWSGRNDEVWHTTEELNAYQCTMGEIHHLGKKQQQQQHQVSKTILDSAVEPVSQPRQKRELRPLPVPHEKSPFLKRPSDVPTISSPVDQN